MYGIRNSPDYEWNSLLPLLILPENLPLDDLNFWQRRKLNRVVRELDQVNGRAKNRKTLWLIAKIHQRLGNEKEFLDSAIIAHHEFPEDLNIITAVTTAALEVGDGKTAIAFTKLGLECTNGQNAVVLTHACLSYLISGVLDLAMSYAKESCRIDPENCYLVDICRDVASNLKPIPGRLEEVFGENRQEQ